MMETYVELVRHRFEDRHANIMGNIEKLDEAQLRFTVRIFGDCIDEEKRKELFGNYTEYWSQSELTEFVRSFLPAYLEYAIAELLEKKEGGERFDPPYLTQEEYQEMAVREKWPRVARHLEHMTPLQLRREIAKAALLFRPYMLSDPGFNEGALEFALYFDLLDRLPREAFHGRSSRRHRRDRTPDRSGRFRQDAAGMRADTAGDPRTGLPGGGNHGRPGDAARPRDGTVPPRGTPGLEAARARKDS